jgi:hypothetical protein
MNMTDNLATLKAAEAAGATIQAYTVEGDDGSSQLEDVAGLGYWRDIEGPVQWTCRPSRYRVKPEGVA